MTSSPLTERFIKETPGGRGLEELSLTAGVDISGGEERRRGGGGGEGSEQEEGAEPGETETGVLGSSGLSQ